MPSAARLDRQVDADPATRCASSCPPAVVHVHGDGRSRSTAVASRSSAGRPADDADRAQRLRAAAGCSGREPRTPAPAARTTPATLSAMQTQPVDEPVAAPDPVDRDVPALLQRGVRRCSFGDASSPIGLAASSLGSGVLAGLGIANEQKWGYVLGVVGRRAAASLPFVLVVRQRRPRRAVRLQHADRR